MKRIKIVLATLLAATFMTVYKTEAFAQDVDDEIIAESEASCTYTYGAYGQVVDVYCDAEAKVKYELERRLREHPTEEEIVYIPVDGQEQLVNVVYHKPVDTALDFKTSLIGVLALLAGGAATVLKIKNRLA